MTKQELELLLENRFGPMVEVVVDHDPEAQTHPYSVKGRFEVTISCVANSESEGLEYVFKEALRVNNEVTIPAVKDE